MKLQVIYNICKNTSTFIQKYDYPTCFQGQKLNVNFSAQNRGDQCLDMNKQTTFKSGFEEV